MLNNKVVLVTGASSGIGLAIALMAVREGARLVLFDGMGHELPEPLWDDIVGELKTTFASQYARTVSLAEALSADAIAFYGPRHTGAKVLIDPSKD